MRCVASRVRGYDYSRSVGWVDGSVSVWEWLEVELFFFAFGEMLWVC